MSEYRTGLAGAHDNARYALRLAREQAPYAMFWRQEAARHFERARWYLGWLRRSYK